MEQMRMQFRRACHRTSLQMNDHVIRTVFRKRTRTQYSFYFALFFAGFILFMTTTQVLVMKNDVTLNGKLNQVNFLAKSSVFGRVLKASDSDRQETSNLTLKRGLVSNKPLDGGIVSAFFSREKDRPIRQNWMTEMRQCLQTGICHWQRVTRTSDKFFVYSAYLDDYNVRNPVVRVIAVARTKNTDKVWCQLGFSSANTTTWRQSETSVKVIREHWNLRYSAVFVLCSLRGLESYPTVVSISGQPHPSLAEFSAGLPPMPSSDQSWNQTLDSWYTLPTGNILPVQHLNRSVHSKDKSRMDDSSPDSKMETESQHHQLSVCVKPFHYEYNRAEQLIEFIELHRLLGVTYFTFYNHTVGPKVNCILEKYVAENLVQVLPWQRLDLVSQKEIRTEGIFASLNDCLYRHMFNTELLLFIDFDEFIIPHDERLTLVDVIQSLNVSTNKTGAFYFRNAFFYLQWPDDPQSVQVPLITLKKVRRNVKLHPHRIRSKYVCRPKKVVEVGNHFVWEFRPGHIAYNVPETIALMHHYRTCEFGGESCLNNPSLEDRSVSNHYRQVLVDMFNQRMEQFRETCHL